MGDQVPNSQLEVLLLSMHGVEHSELVLLIILTIAGEKVDEVLGFNGSVWEQLLNHICVKVLVHGDDFVRLGLVRVREGLSVELGTYKVVGKSLS